MFDSNLDAATTSNDWHTRFSEADMLADYADLVLDDVLDFVEAQTIVPADPDNFQATFNRLLEVALNANA